MIEFAIILFVYSWKHLEIDYYKIIAPILFSLSIFFLVKDFLATRRTEVYMTQIILNGVDLEKKHSGLEKIFTTSLKSFNFNRTLVQRSLINALALGCLGYLIFQFIGEAIPNIKVSRWFLGLFVWVPSITATVLYYETLKVLDKAKEKFCEVK